MQCTTCREPIDGYYGDYCRPCGQAFVEQQEIAKRVLTAPFQDCARERMRQDRKWGRQDHTPMEWLSILGEEVGEACKEANEAHWSSKGLEDYRKEMLEVMAVAAAAVENLDRQLATGAT